MFEPQLDHLMLLRALIFQRNLRIYLKHEICLPNFKRCVVNHAGLPYQLPNLLSGLLIRLALEIPPSVNTPRFDATPFSWNITLSRRFFFQQFDLNDIWLNVLFLVCIPLWTKSRSRHFVLRPCGRDHCSWNRKLWMENVRLVGMFSFLCRGWEKVLCFLSF